ncbi:MAG: isochorismatase family cysteine hydrolase [Candidatus Anstonellales archaeon]
MTKAIIIIDMLNDFVTGSLKCDRAQRIVPNIQKLVQYARSAGIPIIYTNDAHYPQIDHEFSVWGPHAIAGSVGAQVIPQIAPKKGDYVIPKRRYSGFFGTELDELLRELKVDEVVLCGLHTHICVRHTAADAFFRGYKITVPQDCVESFSQEDHESGLAYLKMAYKAEISSAEREISKLKEKKK